LADEYGFLFGHGKLPISLVISSPFAFGGKRRADEMHVRITESRQQRTLVE
jgi:hypothetical protein